jgi:hypothetical protein
LGDKISTTERHPVLDPETKAKLANLSNNYDERLSFCPWRSSFGQFGTQFGTRWYLDRRSQGNIGLFWFVWIYCLLFWYLQDLANV